MARARKISPSPTSAPSVHERIAAAEKALLQGATERVIVSDSDLETIAGLITDTGSTKSQILKKAAHLGLQVLKMGSPAEVTTAVHEEPVGGCMADFDDPAKEQVYMGGWKRMDPIPYAGFELMQAAGRHEIAADPPLTPTGIAEARAVEDLETQF